MPFVLDGVVLYKYESSGTSPTEWPNFVRSGLGKIENKIRISLLNAKTDRLKRRNAVHTDMKIKMCMNLYYNLSFGQMIVFHLAH